jgi:hypothetical protein
MDASVIKTATERQRLEGSLWLMLRRRVSICEWLLFNIYSELAMRG